MASDLQSTLSALRLNDYSSLIVITAVVYDYILTFPREVEYIWSKPWTFVSSAFLLVRYCGLCAFITLALVSTSLLPGPAKVGLLSLLLADLTILADSCAAIGALGTWAVFIFICAADFVMILRIWALYNRSKIVLGILLTSYIAEIIPSIIACIVYSNPRNVPIAVVHVLDVSFCALGFIPYGWNKASSITQLIHAAIMCALVVIRFIKQSFRVYKATKQWQLNKFVNLLVVEGVLYFHCILGWNVVNTLYAWGNFSLPGWEVIFVTFIEAVPFATMAPRFVLNVRALYARSHIQVGRGDAAAAGIDSGFGLSTWSDHDAGRSTMVFANESGQEEDEGVVASVQVVSIAKVSA